MEAKDYKIVVIRYNVSFESLWNSLIIQEKIMKKCSNFKLGQITSRALPTSYSKGNVSPCLGFTFLQKGTEKRDSICEMNNFALSHL